MTFMASLLMTFFFIIVQLWGYFYKKYELKIKMRLLKIIQIIFFFSIFTVLLPFDIAIRSSQDLRCQFVKVVYFYGNYSPIEKIQSKGLIRNRDFIVYQHSRSVLFPPIRVFVLFVPIDPCYPFLLGN
jgi:hypothetical protein